MAEYMIFRYNMLAVKDNGFSNIDINGDSKVVIECYNRNITIFWMSVNRKLKFFLI